MGVWPWLLAKKFAKVITFEPDPVCYDALTQNLAHSPKIECHNMALMDAPGAVHMMNDEPDNLGAQYVAPMPHGIEATTIDALALPMCDLIYLDIEGAELPALQGAKATIKAFKPVVVVEDKGHSSRFGYKKGDSVQWLYQFGYFAVNRRHNDVVLMCKS
jgi:FkbM family methyltransferase